MENIFSIDNFNALIKTCERIIMISKNNVQEGLTNLHSNALYYDIEEFIDNPVIKHSSLLYKSTDKKDKILIVMKDGEFQAIDCTKDIDITIIDWDKGVYADDVINEYDVDNVKSPEAIETYINDVTDVLDERARKANYSEKL
jgi:hypothetical protein